MALKAYSLWIFDRHCEPIYYQDWSHLYRTPSAASGTASSFTSSLSSTFQRVGGTVPDQEKRDASTTTHKRARGDALPGVSQQVQTQDDEPVDTQALPFDQEAKLIYGVVYSLRNMVRKLGGSQEAFHNFSTATYTLSHMQTPTMYTFVLITDAPPSRGDKGPLSMLAGTNPIPGTNGMTLRGVLRELWRGPWIQHGTRHPLADATERVSYTSDDAMPVPRSHGIENAALRESIEQVLFQYKLLPSQG